MRKYIFTAEEERILKSYLESGEKHFRFYDLIHRMRKNGPRLRQQVELMNSVLQKFEGS